MIPAGRMAVVEKQFIPPLPAFGPGSIDYLQKSVETSKIGDAALSISFTEDYAGAGAYF